MTFLKLSTTLLLTALALAAEPRTAEMAGPVPLLGGMLGGKREMGDVEGI